MRAVPPRGVTEAMPWQTARDVPLPGSKLTGHQLQQIHARDNAHGLPALGHHQPVDVQRHAFRTGHHDERDNRTRGRIRATVTLHPPRPPLRLNVEPVPLGTSIAASTYL